MSASKRGIIRPKASVRACRVMPAMLLMAATAMPAYAMAEALLSTGASDNYRARVTSWSEIPFRSVVRQQYDFSCGSAAVATLLSFHYGHLTPERPVFAAMWARGDQATIRRSGFSMLDIKHYLDGIGFRTEGFRLSLDRLRRTDRPGIVILDLNGYKHFVVVKGIGDGTILVGDPMLGITRYSIASFALHWNGIFLMVVAAPPDAPSRFNVATEWAPWARAPLDSGLPPASIAGLTDYLPPLYQIAPAALSGLAVSTGR